MLSKGGSIMAFFDLFKSPKRNSFGQRLDRLTPEGELPFGWIYENIEFTKKVENEYRFFADAYFNSKNNGILNEYAAVKSLVIFMEDMKRICISKGECFAEWSTILVANPETLKDFKERQAYIEENIDELLRIEKLIKKLRSELPTIISRNPGILQTAIYKLYDPECKPHISHILYAMGVENIITRTKSGRTYSLKIKDGR
jgi:hypothetical protein